MSSTFDSSHAEDQENETTTSPLQTSSDDLQELSPNISDEKNEEQIQSSESEERNHLINEISESDETSMLNPTNMVTAEASFTEATSADIPLGATRSSVARILVKPGQIFRVQVDNEVKEVHGKFTLTLFLVVITSTCFCYLSDPITKTCLENRASKLFFSMRTSFVSGHIIRIYCPIS